MRLNGLGQGKTTLPAKSKLCGQVQTSWSRATDGATALHAAAFHGHELLIHLLVDSGADLEARAIHANNCTPLHFAAYTGEEEACKALLFRGADREARGLGGETADQMFFEGLEVSRLQSKQVVNLGLCLRAANQRTGFVCVV